jgi:hypothetical protein
MSNNLKFNKSICERFDKIVRNLTRLADTPDECVEMLKYIDSAKFVEFYQLKVVLFYLS